MPKKSGKASSKSKAPSRPAPTKTVGTISASPANPRRLKQPSYRWFQPHRPLKHPVKLPNVFKLTKSAFRLIWQHKKLFVGITLVYGVLNLIFVRGIAGGTDLNSLKQTFDTAFTGHFGSVVSGLGVFVSLVSSSGNSSSSTAGAYQLFLGLICSLAVIWAFRQVMAGAKLRIRDAYYLGMYPLIPFVIVLLIIGIQLLPMVMGLAIYNLLVSGGIAVGFAQFTTCIVCAILVLLSLYLVSSSLFGLYIVTLPEMTPLKALRSARQLVRYRRWTVLRKILWLPLLLLIIAAVIMVPIIIWLTALAQWVFFVMTMFSLLAIHAYMYTLYRELLNE